MTGAGTVARSFGEGPARSPGPAAMTARCLSARSYSVVPVRRSSPPLRPGGPGRRPRTREADADARRAYGPHARAVARSRCGGPLRPSRSRIGPDAPVLRGRAGAAVRGEGLPEGGLHSPVQPQGKTPCPGDAPAGVRPRIPPRRPTRPCEPPRRPPRTSSPSSSSAVAAAITSTARSKTSRLWAAGARKPETLRTYWRAAARISSSVASSGSTGGRSVLILRHMVNSLPRGGPRLP